jgi:hypothetical protein
MARDIGGYFDKLKRQGEGGRRLDSDGEHSAPEKDAAQYDAAQYEPSGGSGSGQPDRSSGGGGLADRLKDMLRKGRATASTTGKKASEKARTTVDRRRTPTRPSRKLPPEGVVTVEYSPRIDGDPDPGEVVWTWVPFEEDPDQGKDRPVVVIGRRGRSLVGVPLTTKQNSREAQISIGTGDWDPKRRKSYARIWRMLDIDQEKTRREGAVLERRRFDDVVAAVDEYYDVRRPARSSDADDFDYDF